MRYCRFQRARLRTLLDDFPLMEKRLLEVAANELVAAQEQMLLLGRKTARERLASFLLMQSRQGLPCGHPRHRFNLPMTRSDIADYLGLTIETVSRTLTRLRAEGLIDIVSQSELVISPTRRPWKAWRAACAERDRRSARGRTRTGKEFPPGVFETPAVTISPLARGRGRPSSLCHRHDRPQHKS